MIKQFMALMKAFRRGEELANAAAWKTGQIVANLAAFIGALVVLAGTLGLTVEITDAQGIAIAGGIVAVYNVVLTAITSRKVGLLPSRPQTDSGTAPPGPI